MQLHFCTHPCIYWDRWGRSPCSPAGWQKLHFLFPEMKFSPPSLWGYKGGRVQEPAEDKLITVIPLRCWVRLSLFLNIQDNLLHWLPDDIGPSPVKAEQILHCGKIIKEGDIVTLNWAVALLHYQQVSALQSSAFIIVLGFWRATFTSFCQSFGKFCMYWFGQSFYISGFFASAKFEFIRRFINWICQMEVFEFFQYCI